MTCHIKTDQWFLSSSILFLTVPNAGCYTGRHKTDIMHLPVIFHGRNVFLPQPYALKHRFKNTSNFTKHSENADAGFIHMITLHIFLAPLRIIKCFGNLTEGMYSLLALQQSISDGLSS